MAAEERSKRVLRSTSHAGWSFLTGIPVGVLLDEDEVGFDARLGPAQVIATR